MIRVVLPPHLRTLARVDGDVELGVNGSVTQRSILDELEAQYPMLRGTMRDHVTQLRRPLVRFSPVEKIYPTNRLMLSYRKPSQRDPSRL